MIIMFVKILLAFLFLLLVLYLKFEKLRQPFLWIILLTLLGVKEY